MHQRGGVNHFHHRAELDGGRASVADQFGREQQQRRTQPLAAARLQVLPDGRDGIDRCDRLEGDLFLDAAEIGLDQIENLVRGESLP